MGSLYKLVVKVLATKLTEVMSNLISLNQLAFLKGRLPIYGVVVVNELVYLEKKTKSLS